MTSFGDSDSPTPAHGALPVFQKTATRRPNYDPAMVAPMRAELTRLGIEELLTPEAVDEAVGREGTVLVFVNSVCGCAAGGARPAITAAMEHAKRPDHVVTVFAGMEHEAVERARQHFQPYPPSSPQIALLKDGKVLRMWKRQDIEGREAAVIARSLTGSFDELC